MEVSEVIRAEEDYHTPDSTGIIAGNLLRLATSPHWKSWAAGPGPGRSGGASLLSLDN